MKLSKAKLIGLVRPDLQQLGYLEVKDTLTGSHGLFIRYSDKKYYLNLGLTISNYYDAKFTGSYYLSKTTRWSSIWGDIPRNSYARVAEFLNEGERKSYLAESYSEPGLIDGWWDGLDANDIKKFIEVIKLTEKRLLEQKGLITSLENSKDAKELEILAVTAREIIQKGDLDSKGYEFLPKNKIDDIPIEWFKAAEIAIKEQKGILNANTVKSLAGDVWRQGLVRLKLVKK